MSPPQVTIAIVTRDRCEELADAVRSALGQEGDHEVLVVDDGSIDGTGEMLRRDFPAARLLRFEESAGLARRRNDATAAAGGQIILAIDDDAVFSAPDIASATARDFDDARIAAVAIPFIDVRVSPEVHQRAPDADGAWIAPVFRGTAFAARRQVLLDLGGFGSNIYHQGEEWDLSLRMLEAGQLIRLGRSRPIHHFASPKRSFRVMDVYGRRNELLICWTYFPAPWNLLFMAGYAVKGLAHGVRVKRPGAMVAGIAAGLRACASPATRRHPMSRRTFAVDRRLRRAGALRLDQIAP